jgi:4-hydroxybenzoate polyprenyltransferase
MPQNERVVNRRPMTKTHKENQPHPSVASGARAPGPSEGLLPALVKLVRIEYCALGAVGVLLGAYLTTGAAPTMPVILSAVAVLFVGAGCYAFDDLSDLISDRANNRTDRPLVTGTLSPSSAKIVGAISFVLAAAAALLAGTSSGVIILIGAAIAIAYNTRLQNILPMKNVLFASVFPVPLLIGWLAAGGSAEPLLLYCMGLVFVDGLGFETMADIADAEGDRRSGIVTFATRYGTELSSRLAFAFLCAAAVLVVSLFFLPVDSRLQWNLLFLGLAMAAALANVLTALALLRDHTRVRIFSLKRLSLLTLDTGVLAVFLGLLIHLP